MAATVLFDRYRLVDRAGTGGTADVWRAVDEQTGEEVALKRLHPIVFGSDAGRRRLEREFHALRGLRHPGIVPVRDLHVGEDDAALVLDYVDGRSLADRLAGEPSIDPAEAVAIATDVADALAAAHAVGIVHRDVKPGNILLAGDGHARLTDFGIARDDADETTVTATGSVVGTLRYLSPEQLHGHPATPASDVYALAAVTYEMLAGRPVYAAPSPVALVEEQRVGPAPMGDVPAALDEVVRAALAPDPARRPSSVEAFAAELRAAIDAAETRPIVLGTVAAASGAAATSVAAGDAAATGGSEAARPGGAMRVPLPAAAAAAALLFGLVAIAGLAGPAADRGGAAATATPSPTEVPAVETPVVDTDRDQGDGDKGDGDKGKGNGDGDKGNGDKGKGKGKDG